MKFTHCPICKKELGDSPRCKGTNPYHHFAIVADQYKIILDFDRCCSDYYPLTKFLSINKRDKKIKNYKFEDLEIDWLNFDLKQFKENIFKRMELYDFYS